MIEDHGLDTSETIIENAETDSGMDAVLLAQADTGSDPAGSSSSDPATSGGAPGISVIVSDSDNRVTLAASASIEDIKLDGDDLLLLQPDGSQIRVIGGALNVPTFIIGEVEIPQEVLVAALDSNGFNVAAGPGNTLSVSPATPTGSGGEFEDSSGASIEGDGLQTLGLLGDTSGNGLGVGAAAQLQSEGNIVAVVPGGDVSGGIVESEDNPGGVDNDPVAATGTITFFDPDFGETRSAEVTTRTVVEQDINGRISLTDAQLDALLSGFILDTAGGITVESTSAAGGSIDWTYFVGNDAVDFLADGEVITLSFVVRINDGILFTDQAVTITVTGTNDAPFISNVPSSAVQEDDLPNGTSSAPGLLTVTGDFGIDWGADFGDDADTADAGGVQDTPTGLGDRSLTFGAIADQPTQPTTSDGVAVQYVLSAGDAVLTAYKGTGRAEADKVFEVSLSDDGTGSYNFVMLGNVDHNLPGSLDKTEASNLDFTVTAIDAGGDTDAGTFTVIVNDDALVIGSAVTSSIDEEGLSSGNAGEPAAASYTGSDLDGEALVSGGDLAIAWGADDADNGGADGADQDTVTGVAGNRSVTFTDLASAVANITSSIGAAADLNSRGDLLSYALDADGTTLTATADDGTGARTVFTVVLSDDGTGSYEFTLVDALDHSVRDTEDDIVMTFGFTATDSDGDTADSSFAVTVDDDAPEILSGNATVYLDDETATSTHAAANPGGTGDYDGATPATSGTLSHSYGADGEGSVLLLGTGAPTGFTFTLNTAGTGLTISQDSTGLDVVQVTLSDTTSGDYTVEQLNPIDHPTAGDSEESVGFTLDYRVTDYDGDTIDGTLSLDVDDDTPVVESAANARVWLDDDDVSGAGGNAGFRLNPVDGTGSDDVAPVNATGVLDHSYGADGAGTVLLLASGALPAGFTAGVSGDGLTLTITQTSTSTAVLQISLTDATSGAYTVTQLAPIDHTGAQEDNLNYRVSYQVRDGDGDTVDGFMLVTVDDDTPVANGAAVLAGVYEDDIDSDLSLGTSPELPGTQPAVWDLSPKFSTPVDFGFGATFSDSVASVVSFGADGAANGGRFAFTSDVVTKMVALGLTSGDDKLSYEVIGNSLVAYVDDVGGTDFDLADVPIFKFDLDPATGDFTFQQVEQLDHVDGNNGKNVQLQGKDGSLDAIDFGDVIQATDGDGDTVVLTGKLAVVVTDDIVEAEVRIAKLPGGADDYVRIDETYGKHSDNTDDAEVAALFNGVTDPGSDPDIVGPIYADWHVVELDIVGADDFGGTIDLALQIDSIDSGLSTTEGDPIRLYAEDELVVGRIIDQTGDAVFAIHIDNIDDFGHISLALYQSIQHPNTSSLDEHVDLAGKISAVITVTDADGDTVTDTVSIGASVTFDDDGPAAVSGATATANVNEANLAVGIAGDDFVANTETDGFQQEPVITTLEGGRFAMVWSNEPPPQVESIRGRVFEADGTPVGLDFRADSSYLGIKGEAVITPLTGGGFVVTWTQNYLPEVFGPPTAPPGDLDPIDQSVRGRVFDADGVPLDGAEFVVNTTTADNQSDAAVAALPGGGFVVVWTDDSGSDIRGRVFDASGDPVTVPGGDTADFVINTATAGNQLDPVISVLENGVGPDGFVVAWVDNSQDGLDDEGSAIRGRVFNADGTARSTLDFEINTEIGGNQLDPAITELAGGGFVVAWVDYSGELPDSDPSAIRGRVFNNDGTAVNTDDFVINTTTPGYQFSSTITALPDGGFVATWVNLPSLGAARSIQGRVFDAAGDPVTTDDFTINTTIQNTGSQVVTVLESGGFVVAWADDPDAIHGRVFNQDGTPLTASDFVVNTTTAGFQSDPVITALPGGGFAVAWRDTSQQAPDTSLVAVRARVFPDPFGDTAILDLAPLVEFGADGPGAIPFELQDATVHGAGSGPLAVTASDEIGGLVSAVTSMGDAVLFTGYDNTTVSGETTLTATAAGRDVFTVTLKNTGEVTFKLIGKVDHQLHDDPDTTVIEISFVDTLFIDIGALINAIDGDGDTITLDGQVVFKVADDVPSIVGTNDLLTLDDIVTHDESDGLQFGIENSDPLDVAGDGGDELGSDIATGTTTVATLFDSVMNTGVDPHTSRDTTGDANPANAPIGYARSNDPMVILDPTANVDFGADGAAGGSLASATSYALALSGVSGSVASGLMTTAGQQINLFDNGDGVIVGRFDSDGSGGITASDDAAFAITINTVTSEAFIAQYVSLQHPDNPNNFDDKVSIASGAVLIKAQFTDGDGDVVETASVAIGSRFVFEDDGPSATGMTMNTAGSLVQTSIGAGAPIETTIDVSTLVDFGADGPVSGGGFSLRDAVTLGLDVTALDQNGTPIAAGTLMVSGQTVTFSSFDDTVVGQTTLTASANGQTVFTLTINKQTGDFTYNQVKEFDLVTGVTQLQFDVGPLINAVDGDGDTITLGSDQVLFKVDTNLGPEITSGFGGATASVSIVEKSTAVTDVDATDPEGLSLTYSVSGGADAAKFTINASTGELSFITAPDYENPNDLGGTPNDNIYDVQVTATDSAGLTDVQDVAVTVTDNLADNPYLSFFTTGPAVVGGPPIQGTGSPPQPLVSPEFTHNFSGLTPTNQTVTLTVRTEGDLDDPNAGGLGPEFVTVFVDGVYMDSFDRYSADTAVPGVDPGSSNDFVLTKAFTISSAFIADGNVTVRAVHSAGSPNIVASSATFTLSYNILITPADPIILDLGNDGISFTGIGDGVTFDLNANGTSELTAWTTGEDGFLAVDLDGSGAIENGSELFSEVFNGGSYSDSLAALASLDSNGDGVIDVRDAAFGHILVWQDANSDGVSQAGELQTLTERGIASINLTAAQVSRSVEGNTIFAEGAYTRVDGGTGSYVGVSLAAADDGEGEAQAQQAVIAAGLAIILYSASTEEVAAGLESVVITGAPQHGAIVVTDDFTVIYTPTEGFEGADLVALETRFTDGTVSERSIELAVNTTTTEIVPAGSGDGIASDATAAPAADPVDASAVVTAQVITGDAGDNVLVGGAGDDLLFGLDGDDILNGGTGADTLTGGAGADTFVFDAGALADVEFGIQDLIADYDIGEGDVVDLSALLGSETVTDANAADYVRMNGAFLEVDVDGAGTDAGFVQIAEFQTASGTDALKILVDDDASPPVII